MNSESADLVQLAILHMRRSSHTIDGALIGLATLIITSSGFFTEVEDALNVIWKAPRHESFFTQLLRGRVLSMLLVIGLGVLLLASMILATGVRILGHFLDRFVGVSEPVIALVNLGVSYVIVSLLFAAIYKVLPNRKLVVARRAGGQLRHRFVVRIRPEPDRLLSRQFHHRQHLWRGRAASSCCWYGSITQPRYSCSARNSPRSGPIITAARGGRTDNFRPNPDKRATRYRAEWRSYPPPADGRNDW
jgi:hypothetical protein